jgi:hypothetical protein
MTDVHVWTEQEMKADMQAFERSGFPSILSWIQAGKPASKEPLPSELKCKCSWITAKPTIVGYTAKGEEIVAAKRRQRGCTTISFHLADPSAGYDAYKAMLTRESFSTVKEMVDRINELIDAKKTIELM